MFNIIISYFSDVQLNAISVRTIFALITAFVLTIFLVPIAIRNFTKKNIGQEVRKDGPESHYSKSGCPTMGGIVIVISMVITTIVWTKLNTQIVIVLFATIFLGITGFIDDLLKITKKNSKGMSSTLKLSLQTIVSAVIVSYIYYYFPKIGHSLVIPVLKYSLPMFILFIPFASFVIIGSSNAVNLTDGLDGLATGVVLIVSIFYGAISYIVGNKIYSEHLNLNFISGSGELTIFCAAMAGACMGFLWFNSYPAQIFMGDTGSLSLGGAIGVIAVLIKAEILLTIVGGIFVCEALSVIFQVASFKLRGKRIFKMAPIHHHFELCGWHESKVVLRFWIITFILALFGMSLLGINTII